MSDLAALLEPFVDQELSVAGVYGRFVDTPPAVAREALALVDAAVSELRANGQPPASWLVAQAERRQGLLSGSFSTTPITTLRIDALCVPKEQASALATALVDDWAADGDWPAAIDLALAEGWESWDARASAWEGEGRALLGGLPDLPVFGLWWD